MFNNTSATLVSQVVRRPPIANYKVHLYEIFANSTTGFENTCMFHSSRIFLAAHHSLVSLFNASIRSFHQSHQEKYGLAILPLCRC